MSDYKEKIESLKKQQEQAKELFIKLQGAIEVLVSMEEEKSKKDKK
jgi:Holliday junction resolvase RusA-like endonuclease